MKLLQEAMAAESQMQDVLNNTPFIQTTIFIEACRRGHEDLVRMILSHDHCRDAAGVVVRSVLPSPIDVNVAQVFTRATALMEAACRSPAIVKLLLGSPGIDVNCTDYKGRTALFYACMAGVRAAVSQLLNYPGIDVNVKDSQGRTALFYASLSGRNRVVAQLIQVAGIDVNHKDVDGDSAISIASKKGHVGVVIRLMGVLDIELPPEREIPEWDRVVYLEKMRRLNDVTRNLPEYIRSRVPTVTLKPDRHTFVDTIVRELGTRKDAFAKMISFIM